MSIASGREWLSELIPQSGILGFLFEVLSRTGMIKVLPGKNATPLQKQVEGLWAHLLGRKSYYVDFRSGDWVFCDRSNLCQCWRKQSMMDDYEYDSIGFPFFAQLRIFVTRSIQNEKNLIPRGFEASFDLNTNVFARRIFRRFLKAQISTETTLCIDLNMYRN